MFSETKKELVLKGFVKSLQGLLFANEIQLTDKRLGKHNGVLIFKFDKDFLDEIPFERGDDILIYVRVRNGKHGDKS